MRLTEFYIAHMDCPSEERLIRMALEGNVNFSNLSFDLGNRKLSIIHDDEPTRILSILVPLKLGAQMGKTEDVKANFAADSKNLDNEELSVLKKVFAINAVMFVIGLVGGLIAQSTGLISDSLDMFADATVFALSLYAVGKTIEKKKRAARTSGYLQMALAIFAFVEVVRRSLYGSEPRADFMMILAAVALVANGSSMFLLAKHRNKEVHLKASWIFLSNDIIANAGVIVAGALVGFLHSQTPDLVIGAIIAAVVFTGSLRILSASKA